MDKPGKMSTGDNSEAIEIAALREEIQNLRWTLAIKEQRLNELETSKSPQANANALTNDDIARYSRQLILPDFGVAGQLRLKATGFLIVGMGGLGCPAALYLAAAGCGRLGLLDYDEVERSNYHRQTLHTESRLGMSKVESARQALAEINPHCELTTHRLMLNRQNALELFAKYDVVLDCSDNVATRYLLNDACVLLHKPLVSGSALQLDGQLTVYHYGTEGPCYRCLFPVPPPPETVTNCGDGGVLGAVTGVIGALQALEAIKVATGKLGEVLAGRLLIFDGARCVFRNIKLRPRRKDCDICSAQPLITRLIDYEQFCGMHASDKNHALELLPPSQRISAADYRRLQRQPHILIDVRPTVEFEICNLPTSLNVPLRSVLDNSFDSAVGSQPDHVPIVVLCRRGNDSQIAVQHMRTRLPERSGPIRDIIGGLHAWHHQIDKNFPIY